MGFAGDASRFAGQLPSCGRATYLVLLATANRLGLESAERPTPRSSSTSPVWQRPALAISRSRDPRSIAGPPASRPSMANPRIDRIPSHLSLNVAGSFPSPLP